MGHPALPWLGSPSLGAAMDTQGSKGTLLLQRGTSQGISGVGSPTQSRFHSPGSVLGKAAQGASCEDSSLTSVSHQFPGVMKR